MISFMVLFSSGVGLFIDNLIVDVMEPVRLKVCSEAVLLAPSDSRAGETWVTCVCGLSSLPLFSGSGKVPSLFPITGYWSVVAPE